MKRKLIDENGRIFGLISVIDVFAIVAIAVLAVAFATKQGTQAIITAVTPMDDITYEVYVENMPAGRLEALRVGDNVYDNDTRSPIGEIQNIKVEDCNIWVQKTDGTYKQTHVEGRSNVRLTIKAQAKYEQNLNYVNRVSPISVGWGLSIYTPACRFSGVILKIDYGV